MRAENRLAPQSGVLDSWKQIAAYLGRDVSTAKRWESLRGLPVHRIQGGKRGAVYALESEIDAWRLSSGGEPAPDRGGTSGLTAFWVILRRRPYRTATLAAMLAGVAVLLWLRVSGPPVSELRFAPLLSLPGEEIDPAISADGNLIAFAYRPKGVSQYDLYLAQKAGGQPLRLTDSAATERFPQFSADSSQIAFVRSAGASFSVWIAQALGGGERKLIDLNWAGPSPGKPLAWSVHGDSLVVVDQRNATDIPALYRVSTRSGSRTRISEPPPDSFGDCQPVWSPDGRLLAFLRQHPSRIKDIWVAGTSGQNPRRITFDRRDITDLAWAPDGRHLLFISDRGGPDPALWTVPAAGGSPELLAVLPRYSRMLAVSPHTGAIAYTSFVVRTSIWRYGLDPAAEAPRNLITSSSIQFSPEYSPDGSRIAFMSDRTGFLELWVARSDGSAPRQLTQLHGVGGAPRWSPDGSRIAFDIRTNGRHAVCVVGVEAGAVTRMVDDMWENGAPSWSRDGSWIYFGSNRSGRHEVWRIPAGGGTASQVTRLGGMVAFESADGLSIYYVRRIGNRIWRKTLPDGDEIALPGECANAAFGALRVDPRGVACLDVESSASDQRTVLKRWPGNDGPPITLLDLTGPHIYPGAPADITAYHPISISPDGRYLLKTRIDDSQSNIMISAAGRLDLH